MRPSRTIPMSAIIVSAASVAVVGCALMAGNVPGIADSELGLEPTSVFLTPVPIVAVEAAKEAGENVHLGAYFAEGIPPLISHTVEDQLPILISNNPCLDCHNEPSLIGEDIGSDEATPMPVSHYTDLRRSPDTVGEQMVGARYVCTQCHAAQTDAIPLVKNSYR